LILPRYEPVTEAVVEELESIVGSENVSTRPEDLICASYDSSLLRYRPEVVVTPSTTEQVAAVLRLANRRRISVTPRGAGTGAAGSALPVKGGICLDMFAMNRVVSFDPDNLMVVVEPGLICDALNEFLERHGFFFPPDPASSAGCTIGGMVNTNAAGNRAMKYGTTRDHVLWLEVVLPTGEIITTGSATLKSVSGFDLTRLIVGSEGSLGVVTKIGLKVTPLPEAYVTSLYIFKTIEEAVRTAVRIRTRGIIPGMLEFLDVTTAKAVFEYIKLPFPLGYVVLVDCDGYREAAERQAMLVDEIADKETPIFAERAPDMTTRDRYITARKSAFPALARLRPTAQLEDLTVPVTKIAEACVKIEAIPRRLAVPGFDLGLFGHIGDGNLHPTFIFDERDKVQREAFFQALDILYKEVALPLGGSITGEHGIGALRAPYIELEHGLVATNLMREIKKAFDPNMILNPYKGKGGPWPIK